eukprot:GEMP01003403.1.p1 GENE.GEMP01003403.1~~GEMP01003403.1.p1  ORF type:complete len:889 (+),score=277.54 GEMP01003403.1:112-2778(+)
MNRNGCPYTVLGVPRTCTVKEVNSAWRKLSLQCHPDRLKEDDPELQRQYTVRFQNITEAKNQLLAKLPADDASRVQRGPAPKQYTNPWGPKWPPRATPAPKSSAQAHAHASKHSTSAPFQAQARPAYSKENDGASGSTMPNSATHSRAGVPPAMRFPIPKEPQPQAPPRPQPASSTAAAAAAHQRGMFIPQHEKFIPTHRARSPLRSAASNNNNNGRNDVGADRAPPTYKARQPSPEGGSNMNSGSASEFLGPDRSERWPGEDPVVSAEGTRVRPPGKASGKGCGPPGGSGHPSEFRRGGPGDVPPQHQPKRPSPPHYNFHNGAPNHHTDGGMDDRPPQQRGVNGLTTNMMDLLDDDLTMPDPTTRKKTAAVTTARKPMSAPPPSGTTPYQRGHPLYPHPYARPNGGQTHLIRSNVHEFSQFLNMSYGVAKFAREKRTRAAALQARARAHTQPQQQHAPPPVPYAAKAHKGAKTMGVPAPPPKGVPRDGAASSSAVSEDSSDVDDTSSAPSLVSPQLATAEDHCAPTQKVGTNFDMFSDCAPSSSSNDDALDAATVADSDEVIIADDSPAAARDDPPPSTGLASSSSAVPTAATGAARANNAPTGAPRTEVNISDNSDATSVSSSSSGTSPSARRAVPRRTAPSSALPPPPPVRHITIDSLSSTSKISPAREMDAEDAGTAPPRKRGAPSTKDAPDPSSSRSPKSIASSSPSLARTKRRRTSRSKTPESGGEDVGEHSLPARVPAAYLMERFSLDKEDAEIVRRTILLVRKCGKPEGMRVKKISKGYNPRWIELLKSLPIFDVRIARSTRSNKYVHKVRLFDAGKSVPNSSDANEPGNSAESGSRRRRSCVAISSDEDDFGTILRRSGQHVLPWTYQESGESQVFDSL